VFDGASGVIHRHITADLECIAKRFGDRPPDVGFAVRGTPALDHQCTTPFPLKLCCFVGDAVLTDSGFTLEHGELGSASFDCKFAKGIEQAQLVGSANQRAVRQAAGTGHSHCPDRLEDPHQT
jgi:hypothetical protein